MAKSIKLGADTYLDASGVAMDSSGTLLSTLANAKKTNIAANNSIYSYVKTMRANTYAFISSQQATDNPAGTGLVNYCLAYSPGNDGAYAIIVAFANGSMWVSSQLAPSASSITWHRVAMSS